MIPYYEWAPSALDTKGLNGENNGISDFLVVISVNRDSDILSRSNWAVISADLKAKDTGGDIEIHRFGHWACGWIDVLLVRPGTPAAEAGEKWENALADYPVADDEHFSALECSEAQAAWANLRVKERVALCQQCGVSVRAARRDEMPSDDQGEIVRRLVGP